MEKKEDWFKTWFDTVYYHELYAHRDEKEAQEFIQRLLKKLALPLRAELMDLGCGKGRHSKQMFNAGYRVTGLDLSEQSIQSLRPAIQEGLYFETWDMRNPYHRKNFDAVLNLFTSFGYFSERKEDLKVLRAAHEVLKQKGLFLLDYLNEGQVSRQGSESDWKTYGTRMYKTRKWTGNGQVFKEISVKDGEEIHRFQESVRLIPLEEFKEMMKASGFELKEVFGDYQLGEYNRSSSPRLILLAEKI